MKAKPSQYILLLERVAIVLVQETISEEKGMHFVFTGCGGAEKIEKSPTRFLGGPFQFKENSQPSKDFWQFYVTP